jgi:phosphomannomutase
LLNHIREQNLAGPIIVGGDTRMSSEDFARTAAEVFAANWHQLSPDGNYPAVLFMDVPIVEQSRTNAAARPESNAADHVPSSRKPFVPTPLMTFVIRQETEKRPRAAAGATMTASHNYGTDNGYKTLRGITGGIAEQTVTDQLQLEANAMLARRDIIHKLDFEMALNLEIGRVRASDGAERVVHAIERYDPRAAYFRQHLGRYVDFDVIRKSKPMVAVDLLYGTGIGFLDRVLEREVAREEWPIVQQRFHDWREPGFGGSRPDCEDPENIRDMIRYCADHRETVDVGLAVDSDSDRFGVVDPEVGLVNANHILAALYRYRHDNPLGRPVELMGSDLPVCRTIVTSHMLDAMAKRLGGKILALQRIGFKWIGDVMNKEGMKFVIAGEESSGLSVLDFPEKDGILADLLVLEMMCAYGQVEAAQGKRERPVKPLREILEEIWSEYGRWHFHRVDMYGIKRKQKVMDYFRHVYRPAEIAGHAMEEPDKIKAMFSFYGEDDRDNLLIEENRVHGFNPLVGDGVKYYLKVTAAEMRGSEHAPWLDDGIVNASVHVRESGNEPVIRVYTQHRTSRQAMLAIEAQIVDLIREVDQ